MNKIFKVIWSKSKQCYIVVSEMAKNHSGKKKIVVASILAAMAVGSETAVVEVQAGAFDGGQIGSYYATAIGYKANAFTDSSIAIGTYSYSKGTQVPGDAGSTVDPSIAIGNKARAVGNSALAVGMNATADNSFGVAVGRNTEVTGDYGVGIGFKSKAALHGIGIGEQARALKEGATTLGVSSRGYGKGAIAIGWQSLAGADVYTAGVPGNDINKDSSSKIDGYNNWGDMSVGLRALATGGNATALGRNAAATAANAVAIGGGNGNSFNDNTERTLASGEKSAAIGYNSAASGTSASALGTKASASAENAAAIGTSASASAKDTFAAGSSAAATAEGATAVGKAAKAQKADATSLGSGAIASEVNATALGKGATASKADATAVGSGATASEANAVAIGKDAEASKGNAIAIGKEAEATEASATAIGDGANAEKANAVAIGKGAISGGTSGIAIGNDAQAQAADTIAVGSSSRASNANDSAFGNAAQATGGASTAIGYTVNASGDQSFGAGSNTSVSGTAAVGIGYQVTASGNRSISIGADYQGKKTTASAAYTVAMGTGAQASATSAVAIGTNASAGLEHSVALGEGSTTTSNDGTATIGYLTNESVSNSGNGVIAIGNKRNDKNANGTNDTGNILRRIVGLASGTNDYDAANIKQLKVLESNERHIKAKTGNDAYRPDATGKITLNYVNGKGADVTGETAEITDVAKKSDEWMLRTQNGTTTADATPQTISGLSKKAVTLKAGDNIAIENSNGTVTIKAKDVVTSITSGNNTALTISPSNGAVTITPNIASAVGANGEDGKLVTSGIVKTALDAKIDKTAEMHIKTGEYTVDANGTASLIQQNGNNQDLSTRVTIKDIAKKSVVDGINTTVNTHTTQITNLTSEVGGKVSQSEFDTFKAKAITFTGDDNAGVARTLDTTLTVKGGANYTSTTANTNIRVEKDGTTGASGLVVKLSDKLSGMKEIAGNGSDNLVIKNGTNTVTITPGKTGDNGTVNFGDAKVVASNLEADITYRANGVADTAANTVKLKKGLNFTAATDANVTTDGPKSGLSITTGADGLVTFGLDKATRSKVDNAADKNLSNLSDDGKDKVKELAKTAAQDAVKVAPGINTTVDTDTTTTAGVTTYKVNANDTTVAVSGTELTIDGGTPDATTKIRAYTLGLSDATKGKLAAVGNLATVIGGTTIAENGTVTGPTFNITKAEGDTETANTLKDAIDKLNATNAGQNSKISETAGKVTTLEGKVTDLGTTVTNNYNDLSNKITQAGTAATTAATTKGLNFTGDDTTDTGKVHRDLGETLTIKGGENFTRGANENNIKVVKNDKALDVKLAENLANIKEIAGDGTHDLVIKNGDTKVTVKVPKDGNTGSIDFGDTKLVASNLDASIKYRANDEAVANAKSVKLADGFNYVVSNDATTTAEGPKSGLAITAEDNGKVTFGLDKDTRSKVDNAADKNLSNLSDAGKDKVKELAKTAAQDAVKVAPGINTTVTTDTTTTAGVTTYKVNANDTTIAVSGAELTIDGGTPDATTKIRAYTLGLSDATKGKLAAVGNLANVIGGTAIAADGTVTGPTFNITKADGGTEAANTLKDAIDKLNATNAGQNTKISETAGKVATLETNVTNLGNTVTSNYNDLSNKITQAGTNVTTTLTTKGLDFTGNDTTAKVHRDLGTALTIQGSENFTRADGATNNIDVVKNAAGDGLDVKLAENLGNIKEIAGDGTHDLVIKNGDTKVTVKAPKDGDKGSIDFGDTKLVTNNLDANISYKAGTETAKNKVKLQDGFNFVAGTGTVAPKTLAAGETSPTANTDNVAAKKGIVISTAADGVVNIGLDSDTRGAIDNAASKDYVATELANLNNTITGNANLNFAGNVTKNAQDADVDKVGLALATGTLHVKGLANEITTTAKGDTITVELAQTVKDQLSKVGDTASNGRDGANGLTGKDGLNDKTVSEKVNALRNGEAGTVVYTDDAGERLVKANDGKYYHKDDVKADGTPKTADENNGTAPKAVDNPQARVVNANGDAKTATTLSNIADGKVVAGSTEAVNGGQLHSVKSDLATALGGDSKVNADGSFTGPTYNITKDDGSNTTEEAKSVGDAISKLDTRINNANSSLGNKGLDFYGNKDAADTDKVHRNLGEALKVKGAENFTRETTGTNNITVVKNAVGDGLDVKLAENLGNMKGISGNGTDSLVIKNGDATMTLTPAKPAVTDPATGDETTPAKPATVDFGDSNVVAKNLDASITYRTNNAEDANAKSVKLKQGLNFVAATDATTTVEGPKSGLAIATEDNGKVTFGLDKDTRSKVVAVGNLATVIGGTAIAADGTVTGPTFNITKADGTSENATTLKDAIEKLDTANKDQNTNITNLGTRITNLVDGGMTFVGDDATADTVTRKLGETLNIHGQNNISVKKAANSKDTVNVTLASELKNITSITNADADGKPGSKITLGADGVSIANTVAGQDGAAGETKTVTIGKDGIDAGNMKITNVAEATENGDATNKQYVDTAISNLKDTVTKNANLRYAGDTNEGADADKTYLNLPLATDTLKVAGTAGEIKTVAKAGTITLSLEKAVTDKLAQLGDTTSNGRDGANGLTGADGQNGKTVSEKVNALRNGEAGTVVYTDDAGERLVKANDGKYYHKDDVKADGTPKTADENNGTAPKAVDNPQARVVNANGDAKTATTLSNIADGKVVAGSTEAVNGGQLHSVKSDLATALGGDSKVNADGSFTGPTYNITKDDGSNTTEEAKSVGDAISKLDTRINNANSSLGNKGLDFYGNKDAADTDKVHRNLGEALKVKGAENFTRADGATNNIDVVKNAAGDGLDVKLAENLGNIKEIAGDGNTDLVIKNGDASITLKSAKPAVNDPATGDETTPAKPATVDFGESNVVAKNLDASITYRANNDTDGNAKSVKLKQGLNFVAGRGTVAPKHLEAGTPSPTATTDSVEPKKGIAISTAENGVVNIGLDSDTRSAIDNAANQDLSNLTTAGKQVITDAAQGAVKVAAGNNVTIDTTTKDNVKTYTVNGRDTTVKAATGGSVSVTGGNLNAKGEREYTVDLTDAAKAEINRIAGIDTRLTAAEGNITTLQGDMTKAKADIAGNTQAINNNKQEIAKNAGDIKNLQGNSATKDLSNLTNAGKDVVTGLVNVVGTNGITVTSDADTTSRVKTFTAKLDDKVTFGQGDKQITVDGTKGTISVGNNGSVNIDGTTGTVTAKHGNFGTISGLSNTTWNPATVTGTDRSVAATQGQVKDVSDTLQKGRVFTADTGATSAVVALGETLAIKGGAQGAFTDNNIGVELSAGTDKTPVTMTVRLAKNVQMKDGSTSYNYYLPEVITKPDGTKDIAKNADGTVKYQTDKEGNPISIVTTTVNGEGVTITPVKGLNKPSVSLTADGLDNGGNAIHHVGPGTAADDAATLGQVVAAASAVSRQVNQTGAHAAALAAMNPLSYDPLKKSQVMAGYGAYKGNSALALGVAHYANEDTLFNVGVSVGNGENMVNAGMTYRFGGEDSMIPERYKGGPISSVYVMQDEITALKAENARKDAENAKKDAENEEMKAQIKMLIERVTMLEAKK